MTWLWRIFSSLACGAAILPLWAGSVTGRVELSDSADRAARRAKDFSGVVVWLEPLSPAAKAPAGPPPPAATMVQRGKRFVPHVLAVQVGTPVDFPNRDPIFHNAFSSFDGQIFDIGLYPPGTSRQVVFRRSGIVRVFCNIHPMMSAVIAVLPTPWFAVSDRHGVFRIENVPPGEYQLKVFHERALPETLAALERNVKVGSGDCTLEVLRISESGYVPVPHKNKHGEDYPPSPDEHVLYPGVRP